MTNFTTEEIKEIAWGDDPEITEVQKVEKMVLTTTWEEV